MVEVLPSPVNHDEMGSHMLGSIIIFLRNIVLAAVLAWLGIEFAPDNKENAPKSDPVEKVLSISFSK